jgi:hypothetical protein
MLFAGRTKIINHLRRFRLELNALFLFAIEKTEGIFPEPPLAVGTEIVNFSAIITYKFFSISRAAFFVADGIYMDNQRRKIQFFKN